MPPNCAKARHLKVPSPVVQADRQVSAVLDPTPARRLHRDGLVHLALVQVSSSNWVEAYLRVSLRRCSHRQQGRTHLPRKQVDLCLRQAVLDRAHRRLRPLWVPRPR